MGGDMNICHNFSLLNSIDLIYGNIKSLFQNFTEYTKQRFKVVIHLTCVHFSIFSQAPISLSAKGG